MIVSPPFSCYVTCFFAFLYLHSYFHFQLALDSLLTYQLNYPSISSRPTVIYRSLSFPPQPLELTVAMATSDLDQLLEMGFDKERAQIAVTKTGGRKLLFRPNDFIDVVNTNKSKEPSNGWKRTRTNHSTRSRLLHRISKKRKKAPLFSQVKKPAVWCATNAARSSGAMRRQNFTLPSLSMLISPNRLRRLHP